jgi:uroporphyrin-III C-methyltransferase/precorrin-2 dehydrogenase/sirohydrochlorin ferrochelatase
MTDLLPLFLNLRDRKVLLVGGGVVATAKLKQLTAAGARIRIVSPAVSAEVAELVVRAAHAGGDVNPSLALRPFDPADLDDVWLVVAAAPPIVNQAVAALAETRRIFVNAVDDPANATAFLSGVVRRDGVTVAISTSGSAPALTALLREALDAVLPDDLATWVWRARAERIAWRRDAVPMGERKPLLLAALNKLYLGPEATRRDEAFSHDGIVAAFDSPDDPVVVESFRPGVPWLNAPEDSWL